MLKVALLCSRRAPGLSYLLEHDAQRGRSYELVVGLTSDGASEALPVLRQAGIPALIHDIRGFYAARGAPRQDLGVRAQFDRGTTELLSSFDADLVVLSGYLHIVTPPLLAAYPGRVISVHDADLSIRGADGRPKYRGLHATRDAVRAGEPTTRCSLHVVTNDVDEGPLLLRSVEFPVRGRHHYLQREWMMQAAWGPLIARGLELMAREPARSVPAVAAGA